MYTHACTCIHGHRHSPQVNLQSQICTSQIHGPTSQTQAPFQTHLPVTPAPYTHTHAHMCRYTQRYIWTQSQSPQTHMQFSHKSVSHGHRGIPWTHTQYRHIPSSILSQIHEDLRHRHIDVHSYTTDIQSRTYILTNTRATDTEIHMERQTT